MKHIKQGFTLIEILIVIAIIALIMGVFLPNFNEMRRKSRDQSRKAGVKAFVEALELYKINHSPPAYLSTEAFGGLTPGEIWEEGGVTYMNAFPKDPLYDVDPTEFYLRYNRTDTVSYIVAACLEDTSDPEGKTNPNPALITGECTSEKWYYKYTP
jgi:prepilin-type N-terminal cleavage/methylation domain-containing protein